MTSRIDTILQKNITRRRWPALLCVLLFTSLVAGCGGGGGGGGNNPAIIYNGVTKQDQRAGDGAGTSRGITGAWASGIRAAEEIESVYQQNKKEV